MLHENKLALETATLNLHVSGDHRNTPDSSRDLYQPFADMFELVLFGVSTVDNCVRAYVDNKGQRMWIVMFWQEEWPTSIFSDKYIKGKIVYQQDPKQRMFFSRTYYLKAPSSIWISEVEDQCWTGEPLPDDCIKDLGPEVDAVAND